MRGYVETRWGQIHYRKSGLSGPALVLFAESPLSSSIFQPSLPLLARSLRAWAFDTPGYGLSDPPGAPIEIPDYAARLLAAVDALDLEAFVVAGTHTGALIALEIALQAGSDRATHAVLCGVPLFNEQDRGQYEQRWPELQLDPEGLHLDWAWKRYQRSWGSDSPPELLHLGAMELLVNYARYAWSSRAAYRYDPRPGLAQLKCPVLLLNAEGGIFAHTDPEVLALIPNGRLKVVPGLRGQLPWRAPEIFASEIIHFISTVQ